jgi:hypothetical protein
MCGQNVLVTLVEAWERQHYPLGFPAADNTAIIDPKFDCLNRIVNGGRCHGANLRSGLSMRRCSTIETVRPLRP